MPAGDSGDVASVAGSEFALATLQGQAAQSSFLLGWLVGLIVLLAYPRTRPRIAAEGSSCG